MDINLIWKYRIEDGGSVRCNCFDSKWDEEVREKKKEGDEKIEVGEIMWEEKEEKTTREEKSIKRVNEP